MKLPLSWLSEFVVLPKNITVDKIVAAFVKVGFEVEGVENPAESIKGPLVVGKVLSIEELTGHKKPIRYVGLDCGEKKTRFVICGATNFAEGDYVGPQWHHCFAREKSQGRGTCFGCAWCK